MKRDIEEFSKGMRVAYIPYGEPDKSKKSPSIETGTVSSVNDKYVFVKFDKDILHQGEAGVTSKACDPRDLYFLQEV